MGVHGVVVHFGYADGREGPAGAAGTLLFYSSVEMLEGDVFGVGFFQLGVLGFLLLEEGVEHGRGGFVDIVGEAAVDLKKFVFGVDGEFVDSQSEIGLFFVF